MSDLRITDCPTNDICELYLKLAEQIEAYKQADHEASEIIAELKHENEVLRDTCNAWGHTSTQYIEKIEKYKQSLEEIRELAEVNSINTCWTILNNCNDCHNNNECGEQSPIAKLKFIKDKVNEVLNDN